MAASVWTAPGITRLRTVKKNDLPEGAMYMGDAGVPVSVMAPWVEIPFLGVPELKLERTPLNGGCQEKVTLQFRTLRPLRDVAGRAWVVDTASGEQLLIGSRETRRPLLEYTEQPGEPGGTTAGVSNKVTCVGSRVMVRCIL